ncbi:MAG: carbon storage regulator CsrA [Lactococcus lactis]
MLILERKVGEKIKIGDDITLVVTRVDGDRAYIGIDAPRNLPVHRSEIYEKIKRNKEIGVE